jgi:hypothetical protein
MLPGVVRRGESQDRILSLPHILLTHDVKNGDEFPVQWRDNGSQRADLTGATRQPATRENRDVPC